MDLRARKSGGALRDAMLDLLERKPLDQITVLEIASQAGVHRATFFRHYPTRERLLDDVAADQVGRLVELTLPILDTMDNLAAVEALLDYVGQHRRVWSALLSGASDAMHTSLFRYAFDVAKELRSSDALPIDLVTKLSVSIILDGLSWWLSQDDLGAAQHSLAASLSLMLRSVESLSPLWAPPAA